METFLDVMDWMAFTTGMIGAPLGLIEIFKPKLADRIEEYLDFIGSQNEEGELERMAEKYVVRFQMLVLIAFPLVVLLLYQAMASTERARFVLTPLSLDIYWWICIWIIVLIAFSGILFFILAKIIQSLDSMTGGHALGGFGVILILIGTLCDLADKILDNLLGLG